MHELSIAYNLVEIAERAAQQAEVAHVLAVHLRLGELSGVEIDPLLFGYDVATQGTRLEGSLLKIERIPIVAYCPTCDVEVNIPSLQLFQCPICGTPTGDIRQGRELELTYLEVADETTSSGNSAGCSGEE
jgi:hydrogenase nickel incorporation protein HypA/HybF